MSNWTNTTKNTAVMTNAVKNSAVFSNSVKSARYEYITTDTPDFIYVGENEDEVLVFSQPAIYSNLIKN